MKTLKVVPKGTDGYEDYTVEYYLEDNLVVKENWSKENSHSKGHFLVNVFTHNTIYSFTLPPLFGRNHAHLLNENLEQYGFCINSRTYIDAIDERKAMHLERRRNNHKATILKQEKLIRKLERSLEHEKRVLNNLRNKTIK